MGKDRQLNQSRYDRTKKKQKKDRILNGLIIFVLILIFIVARNIFFGNGSEKASNVEQTENPTEQIAEEEEKGENTPRAEEQDGTDGDKEDEQEENEASNGNEEHSPEGEEVVTEGGSSPNVIKTIVNPAWEPVGTEQTGEHSNNYDMNGIDWKEMVKAISYAIGLDEQEFKIYWLGNNGHNKSVGTVYNVNDKDEIYRVYIEWVDGKGWKPTKVEMLAKLEK